MRVLFMGTPEFAVASLSKLYDAGYEICGVFTQPDKPKNRGMNDSFSPVKEYAVSKGLCLYQPQSIRNDETIRDIRGLSPDIIVVVAYGKILPQAILDLPPLGVVNVHGSLLPKYRGAAPIQWAVINGEKKTGVVTMFMAAAMDSGDVIDRAETVIGEEETFGELYARLKDMGAALLLKTLREIESGTVQTTVQDESQITYAPPIRKQDCRLDFSTSADEIINKVRGLQPKPAATAVIGEIDFKIHQAKKTTNRTEKIPGSVVSADRNGLEIACRDGETVLVTQLQVAGSRRMSAADYLLGHRIGE